MNAYGYYEELTGESPLQSPETIVYSATIESILNAKLPGEKNADLRKEPRKEWAKQIRALLKELKITGASVTTPSYSMASSVSIQLEYGKEWENAHTPAHEAGEAAERLTPVYRGSVHFCPYCKARKEAHDKIESILLSAFPDLNDRSDLQSDYFDYCLSIHY